MGTNLTSKLNCLINILKDENYFRLEHIANEVPFYIFDYDPEAELDVRKTIKIISDSDQLKYRIEVVNIYDFIISYLQEKDFLEKIFEMEQKLSPEKFLTRLKSIIDPELIINKIVQLNDEKNPDVFILTGIGNSYPIIRIHQIINRLQEKVCNKVVIVMYPGTFDVNETEGKLILFNSLESKAFYRAFKICGGSLK
ncbi:DUF1788 domain-containing protein [Calditerrivibrio nitroreducens]|uniref:DUF1788 domain-containing protein n=1 Tax=Calditerrivibrio nitroreducens (strain DSM 19672 / NBRC 101217 / Yu37-1) TaxID=768670 RepID=E4THR1_CALNY|nr:DUF1788 domain-containing protein [Calditerrivibrio nitroreducens]ADR19922.1 Domain of unknown function DUF1788 [Calditerrivibrio nitroreducens DSM 19672]